MSDHPTKGYRSFRTYNKTVRAVKVWYDSGAMRRDTKNLIIVLATFFALLLLITAWGYVGGTPEDCNPRNWGC